MSASIGQVEAMLALSRVPRFGAATLSRLQPHLPTAAHVWEAPATTLRALAPGPAVEALVATRRTLDPGALHAQALAAGCAVVTLGSPAYPPLLGTLSSAPLALYVRGSVEALSRWPTVAVVGTRRASAYALRATERFVEGFSRAGLTVVSGMARGVDEAAHRRALACNALTVAVLGCGVDLCYPPESRSLKAAIERQGAVVSPFPPGEGPMPWHFPARNRIISGLSRAVLVVEAGMRSGAMITAEYAIDYERPLFAVPGSILTEVSAGCNQLLAEGTATFARDAGDVLCELGLTVPPVGVSSATDDESAALLAVLEADDGFADGGWLEVEEIAARSGMPMRAVARLLVRLEMTGRVQRAPGNRYRARSPLADTRG